MRTTRRAFIRSGLALPAAGFRLSAGSAKTAVWHPGSPGGEGATMEAFKPEYTITEMKKGVVLAWGVPGRPLEPYSPGENRSMEHVLYIDGEVGPGTLYSECLWFFPPSMVSPRAAAEAAAVMKGLAPGVRLGPRPHMHPFDELFTFFGSDFDDPSDLGAEMEFWLEDRPVAFNRSSIVHIPAGMKHCPLNMGELTRPVFHFSMGFTPSYTHTVLDDGPGKYAGERDVGKYFVFGNGARHPLPPYRREMPESILHPVAHLDADVVPGSGFRAETWWIRPEKDSGTHGRDLVLADPHSHPCPQVIGFFGSDFGDIHRLHGEVELRVEGKPYILNRSFAAFIPEGVEHGPLMVRKVSRPIFHYTVGRG